MIMRISIFILFFSTIVSYGLGANARLKFAIESGKILKPIRIVIDHDRVFVLDNGDQSVKWIDSKGNIQQKYGKRGQGPGECMTLIDFFVEQNKIYLYDSQAMKMEVFSIPDSKYENTIKLNVLNAMKILPANSRYFIYSMSFQAGQKLISVLDRKNLKVLSSFLDCVPMAGLKFEDIYKNMGTIAILNEQIFFIYMLDNKVLSFDQNGKKIAEYSIPLAAVEKPEIVRKGSQMLLKRALNYDLKMYEDKLYVLSRNEHDRSVLFIKEKDRFIKKYEFDKKLIGFALKKNEFWSIEEEEGDIMIYEVNEI